MAEQGKVLENKVTVTGMSVKGGELADGFQAYTNVTFDFTGVETDELIALNCEGSSIRVKAQAQMRKWTQAQLLKVGVQGIEGLTAEIKEALADITPHVFIVDTDFEKADRGPQDPVKTATRQLGKMDTAQKITFLRNCGFTDEADKLQASLDEEQQSETTS